MELNNDFKFSDQTAISSRLETRNFEIVQQGLWYESGGCQDRIPEGDLPVAHVRVGLLRGQADDGPQLPRAPACGHQQARSQSHPSTNEGEEPILKKIFFLQFCNDELKHS